MKKMIICGLLIGVFVQMAYSMSGSGMSDKKMTLKEITLKRDVALIPINWSSDGNMILADGERSGISLIKISDNKMEISSLSDNSYDNEPVFSSDGKKVAFLYKNRVKIFDLRAKKIKEISIPSALGVWQLAWFPQQDKLLFVGGGKSALWELDIKTGSYRKISDQECVAVRKIYDDYIVLEDLNRIFRIYYRTGRYSLITNVIGRINSPISVSTDGKLVLFSAVEEQGRKGPDGFPEETKDIWRVNIDGSNKTQMTDDGDSYDPAWAPDSSKVAWISGGNIWMMDKDGKQKKQLTYSGNDRLPAWSPDGKKIAFIRSSTSENYLMLLII